jgi:hypothetical protein
MQGGKNWFLLKEMNANRFFCDSHWLEIWSNHFYPSMGPNGGSVAMDSCQRKQIMRVKFLISACIACYRNAKSCIFFEVRKVQFRRKSHMER